MTAIAKMECVILFEDEIRIAAKLVKQFFDMPQDATDEEYSAAAKTTFMAFATALNRAEEDDVVLLLGRKPAPVDKQTGN